MATPACMTGDDDKFLLDAQALTVVNPDPRQLVAFPFCSNCRALRTGWAWGQARFKLDVAIAVGFAKAAAFAGRLASAFYALGYGAAVRRPPPRTPWRHVWFQAYVGMKGAQARLLAAGLQVVRRHVVLPANHVPSPLR